MFGSVSRDRRGCGTRDSVCRTVKLPASMAWNRFMRSSSEESDRSVRAFEALIFRSMRACWISSGNWRRRTIFATCGLLFPTFCPTSSCVILNSSMRRLYAIASSMGFRSCRWMFSMSAISSLSCSEADRTMHGTVLRPAMREARSRRSPAMSSYVPFGSSVTTSG